MAQPLLPDLLIEGYRGLRRLELKKLGNVNLIVGQNGVGKTSVLEAVRLYSSQASIADLTELLQIREEPSDPVNWRSYEAMFFGRSASEWIRIGPNAAPIAIRLQATVRAVDQDGVIHFKFPDEISGGAVASIPTLTVEQAGRRIRYSVFEPGMRVQTVEIPSRAPNTRSSVVDAGGLSYDRFGKLWDRIVLTDFEDELDVALRSVIGGIQRVSLVQSEGGMRRAMVKLADTERPVPLRTLGDGIHRYIGIALALANAKDGLLLVDEFENGLHYKTQEALWKFVIRMARELNVQVFATTHSQDCINAFGRAAEEDKDSYGVLTKLERVGEDVVAKQLYEDDIVIASQNLVEIR